MRVKGEINDVTVSEKIPINFVVKQTKFAHHVVYYNCYAPNFIIIVLLLTKLYMSKKWVH
jgi:hypothetical protein